MASLSDIVNVTVSTLTAAIKQPGFGIPLIADAHSVFAERVRHYSDLDSMVDDGFSVTSAAYRAASAAFAQDPQLNEIAIGRRALAPTLQLDITPTAQNAKAYEVTVYLPNGTTSVVSYTSDANATVAEITAGLQAVINPLTGVAASDQTTFVRVTAEVAGTYFAVKVSDKALLSIKSTGADPGIATDLAAIKLEDDTWYGLTLTSAGAAEIAAAATWVESNKKLMLQASQDGDIIAAGSGDIASTVKTANAFRTGLIFSSDPTQHAGAAWLGKGFPIDPGGLTFANLTLASVNTETLTGTHITQLKAKNCNYMTDYGGIALTRNGVTAAGEFIDIIRDRDWYESILQTGCLSVMVNNNKVPMTDAGIAKLEAAVRAATRTAIDAGFLAEGTDAYVVPLAASISSNDRANRTLGSTPIKVSARVAGAIHVAEIRATITA
jgi:hypothetical protein